MAPVILALRRQEWVRVRVLATAQHREMLDQVLSLFGIVPDLDLDTMRPNQTLAELTARLIGALDACLAAEAPAAVLAQGDTTTVMTVALAAFYRRIPFGHVEAGLRTGDMNTPFPEEMNRVLAGRLAHWHFAPTASAAANLGAEGIPDAAVTITGNTVIDALLDVAARCEQHAPRIAFDRRLILITAHRRENFGAPFAEICRALRHLADRYSDVELLYPVHPNPNIREAAFQLLGGHPRIHLCEPLEYPAFVAAMKRAAIILTDSGGVQEEAPALGRPVLVLRNETERPEAVQAGVVKLVGTAFDAIVSAACRLLDDSQAYAAMARGVSPYGDGKAAERICETLRQSLTVTSGTDHEVSGSWPGSES